MVLSGQRKAGEFRHCAARNNFILRPPFNRSLSGQGRLDPRSELGREYLAGLGRAQLGRCLGNAVNTILKFFLPRRDGNSVTQIRIDPLFRSLLAANAPL